MGGWNGKGGWDGMASLVNFPVVVFLRDGRDESYGERETQSVVSEVIARDDLWPRREREQVHI